MKVDQAASAKADTIILLTGTSQYDVLADFITGLAQGFSNLGYNTPIVNLHETTAAETILQLMNQNAVKFFLGINCIGFQITSQNRFIYDISQIPLIAYFVDHPCYHLMQFPSHIEHLKLMFCDQTHLEDFQRFIHKPYPTTFLPHGGETRVEIIKPYPERPIPLVFFGSFTDFNEIENRFTTMFKEYPFFQELLYQVVEAAFQEKNIPLTQILFRQLEQVNLSTESFSIDMISFLVQNLDMVIRSLRRQYILNAITDVPIKVYGNGWEHAGIQRDNIQFLPSASFTEVLEIMNHARAVLNILPNFTMGGHERIFYSMLQGAVSISDKNLWLESWYTHGENIYFYDINEDSIRHSVRQALENPQKAAEVALQGQQITLQNHTWASRAQEILAFAEEPVYSNT